MRSRSRTPDDRAWSAHTNVDPRTASAELVEFTSLPAETGPVWAPDSLSVWPVEGGRYGIDAHYHGPTGRERAEVQKHRLERVGLSAKVKRDHAGALIRLGPFPHAAVWLALEAFLGKPMSEPTP